MTDTTEENKLYCESYKELIYFDMKRAMRYVRRGDFENARFFVSLAQGSIESMLVLLEMAGKEK